jgi:CheY-like chemotaxis protein
VVSLADVPGEHVRLATGTGDSKPRHLLVAPLTSGASLLGVIELGFMAPPHPRAADFLTVAGESAGIALRSARYRAHLQDLLAETQRQAEELQVRQEELRVSNEELEEQSRALQRSQAQMEHQQQALEESNAQLEEQTQALEHHRDRLEITQATLAERAAQLARTNQYKSEFLANMSHELRTPLNSTLILAKLLADNKDGNLTADQVRFAQTIHSSGEDLLALINDILDLARIESGRMRISAEPVTLARALEALMLAFQPVAAQKALRLLIETAPGTPTTMRTDPQRLQQILRNLLSNALKFTTAGEVVLSVAPDGPAGVLFAVRDSGIGIAEDQQEVIFDAFRQADGSIHRKYGGTGLGLAISRDLARRMGGDLTVESALGRGSVFRLVLPVELPEQQAERETPAIATAPAPIPPSPTPPVVAFAAPLAEDDRTRLQPGERVILVIEDDLRFARILADVVHEQGFHCLIAPTGTEGLALARQHRPSAIVLDMNLPDVSGLSVLERLKRDPATRHIPTHVVSIADFSRRALELGAVGYALKPIDRDDLEKALRKLREKFEQTTGHVLVVEDVPVQRDAIRRLLESDVVTVSAVGTAADALEALRTTTFDCMVLDLGLPDLSGFEVLERISSEPEFSFPPVIVYTARALTTEEEMRLGRYSHSVVIKGARSPERLLDEVTLFLHRLESTLPHEQQRMLRAVRDREAAFEGRTILLAEDDVRNIFALSSALEPRGAKVVIARNGREAIQALERASSDHTAPIDIVLMDVMMPQMDGLAATREIRKRAEWPKLPIIAITAKAMADDRDQCIDAGANDYIAKPIDVDKLLSLLRVWMTPR